MCSLSASPVSMSQHLNCWYTKHTAIHDCRKTVAPFSNTIKKVFFDPTLDAPYIGPHWLQAPGGFAHDVDEHVYLETSSYRQSIILEPPIPRDSQIGSPAKPTGPMTTADIDRICLIFYRNVTEYRRFESRFSDFDTFDRHLVTLRP